MGAEPGVSSPGFAAGARMTYMRIYLWQALTFEITKLIIVVMNKNNLIRKSFTVSGQVQGSWFQAICMEAGFHSQSCRLCTQYFSWRFHRSAGLARQDSRF